MKDSNTEKGRHKASQFIGSVPRRVYKAVAEKVWINAVGDIDGEYVDKRVEISLLNK